MNLIERLEKMIVTGIYPKEIHEARDEIERVHTLCEDYERTNQRLAAEIERLQTEVIPDKQRCIDYWGQRTEKAEAEIGRLQAMLVTLRTDCDCEPAHEACRRADEPHV